MACEKHNYPHWGCPHCAKEERHRRIVEEQAKTQTEELQRQSKINQFAAEQQQKLLNEQRKISSLKQEELEEQRQFNKKLLKIEKKESEKRLYQSYIEQLNIILPEIENKYQKDFILKIFLRLSLAINIWSDNLISKSFIKEFLIYKIEDHFDIIEKGQSLIDALEHKKLKFLSDLMQIKRNEFEITKSKNKSHNSDLMINILIGILVAISLTYFKFGIGFLFIIITILSCFVGYVIYDIFKESIGFPDEVTDDEVEIEFEKMILTNGWLQNEVSCAKQLANALKNGKIIYMPLLSQWELESSSLGVTSENLNSTLEYVIEYNILNK